MAQCPVLTIVGTVENHGTHRNGDYLFIYFISLNDKGPQPLTCHNQITVYINECH